MTLAFVAGIPGALLALSLSRWLRGKGPLVAVLLLMAVTVGICPLLLTDAADGHGGRPHAFSVVWGMAIGFAGEGVRPTPSYLPHRTCHTHAVPISSIAL